MNYKLFAVFLALFLDVYYSSAGKSPVHMTGPTQDRENKIIVEMQLSSEYYKLLIPNASREQLELLSTAIGAVSNHKLIKYSEAAVSGKTVKWVLHSNTPLSVFIPLLGSGGMVYPGDSIHIHYNEKGFLFSGKGFEGFKIRHELKGKMDSFTMPGRWAGNTNSLEDYLKWNRYLDSQLTVVVPLIDSYQKKLTTLASNTIKADVIRSIEQVRIDAFSGLLNSVQRETETGLTLQNLALIFDSTQYKSWAKWLRSRSDTWLSASYFYAFNRYEVMRKFGFDLTQESINSSGDRRLTYYNNAKQKYKGLVRERLLQHIITDQVLKELWVKDPARELILKDYYSLKDFPEYKRWVKEYEIRVAKLASGKFAPDFALMRVNGKTITKNDLKGKIALLDFWFTGCKPCIQMTPMLQKIENVFKGDSGIVFLSISTDADKQLWLKSLAGGKYATDNSLKVYTNGQGKEHGMIKDYDISSYPELYLFDGNGVIAENPLPDPRKDSGKALIKIIENLQLKALKEKQKAARNRYAESIDGPYVFYRNDSIVIYNINNRVVSSDRTARSTIQQLYTQTDQPEKSLSITLKQRLETEPATYSRPEKLFALSDIEGNFEAFRTLLQNSQIIDEDFNWTFGSGHLVFAGDMFDRGNQVTECLWLIYFLEEKAKVAGGYVHFVLGNHEIMNLQGDNRYVIQKYKDNSVLIGKTLVELYNEDSELGRWLRTKNIIEKIGNLLFVHGGISPAVNRMSLSLEEINSLVRPYFSGSIDSSNRSLLTLFNSKTSPFWFRGYYGDIDNIKDIPGFAQVDSTLQKFNVAHIVTGHTVRADTVSVWYDGKVINTDTKHAAGNSEALLIEGDKFYRVNQQGKKVLLFTNDRRKKLN